MRLINADELIKTLQEREDAPPGWEGATFKDAFSITIMDIIAQPSIDAVPVIRCKDCIYFETDEESDYGLCQNSGSGFRKNDFCSDAERRKHE